MRGRRGKPGKPGKNDQSIPFVAFLKLRQRSASAKKVLAGPTCVTTKFPTQDPAPGSESSPAVIDEIEQCHQSSITKLILLEQTALL